MDKQFWIDLAKQAGIDPSQPLEAAVANEKFVGELSAGYKRAEDFRTEQAQLAADRQKVVEYYQGLLKTTEQNEAVVNQHKAAVAAYEKLYGPLDEANMNKPPVVNPDFVPKKDYEATIAQLPILVAEANRLSMDYYLKFGKTLPLAEVYKINAEKGLPLTAAYDAFIAPELAAKQAKEHDEAIARAKKEGADEYARTHSMPIDSKPADPHFLFDRPADNESIIDPRQRANEFKDFWRSPEMAAAAGR